MLTTQQLEWPKLFVFVGLFCFVFFSLPTHTKGLLKEIGNATRNTRYAQKILIFMLICANQRTS